MGNTINKLKALVLPDNGRYYTVKGKIIFVLEKQDSIRRPDLATALNRTHYNYPWKDPEPDVLNAETSFIHDINRNKEILWSFEVTPTRQEVTFSQAYEYELYLAKLAKELIKLKLSNILEVRSVIEVKRLTRFS